VLAMVGHALLAVLAANAATDRRGPVEMIALTCAEVRRLFTTLERVPRIMERDLVARS
jgi:hypothetical protein